MEKRTTFVFDIQQLIEIELKDNVELQKSINYIYPVIQMSFRKGMFCLS